MVNARLSRPLMITILGVAPANLRWEITDQMGRSLGSKLSRNRWNSGSLETIEVIDWLLSINHKFELISGQQLARLLLPTNVDINGIYLLKLGLVDRLGTLRLLGVSIDHSGFFSSLSYNFYNDNSTVKGHGSVSFPVPPKNPKKITQSLWPVSV
jgi:hypothetical protein